ADPVPPAAETCGGCICSKGVSIARCMLSSDKSSELFGELDELDVLDDLDDIDKLSLSDEWSLPGGVGGAGGTAAAAGILDLFSITSISISSERGVSLD